MRVIVASTSYALTIIRSASSSMTMTMYGIRGWPGRSASLYPAMLRTPRLANSPYRLSIVPTVHFSALTALSGSTITSVSRCGMPLYCASSTRFGSMRISFTSVGVALIRNEPMIALTQTLLPEPVAPAMSRCGIFDRSALEGCPATSWPRAKASFERLATSPWVRLASTSFRVTRSNAEFGISTPTYGSPGIGASIRMLRAASASARLSDRPSIRLSLMPGSTSSAYWVTTGPSWIRATFTPMPKCASVSRMR